MPNAHNKNGWARVRNNGLTWTIGGVVALIVLVATASGLRSRDVAAIEMNRVAIAALQAQNIETHRALERLSDGTQDIRLLLERTAAALNVNTELD